MSKKSFNRAMLQLIKDTSTNPSTSANPDVSKPEEPDPTDLFQIESMRLKSFQNWPYLLPKKLSTSGFYSTGIADEVKCFACQTSISNWDSHFDLRHFHESNCQFSDIPSDNVPLSVKKPKVSTDQRPNLQARERLTELPDSASNRNSKEYDIYDDRLNTFVKWPKYLSSLKEELAAAGFIYTGKGDNTKCFRCEIEMSSWIVGDDPWKRHAKYSKMCYYLFVTKGRKYVYDIMKIPSEQINKVSFIYK